MKTFGEASESKRWKPFEAKLNLCKIEFKPEAKRKGTNQVDDR